MKYLSISFLVLSLFFINQAEAQPPNYPKEAKEAVLISTDIQNFIGAFNSLTKASDTVQIIQSLYIDKATTGLKEYIGRFNLTAESIFDAIQKNPEEYKKIESFYARILTTEKEFIKEMETYKTILPGAVFAPTYLLIADFKGIGQASKFGQLISIEKKCIDNSEILKDLIVHELTHFQQAITMGMESYGAVYAKKDNMLDMILREGGAEFITFKLVRKNESRFTKLKTYEKNEATYWRKFKGDLEKQDKSFWLNASFEEEKKGIPVQLGYGLGYKIVEAYYNNAVDKEQALNEILNISDASAFLEKSSYSPKH